MSVAVAVLAQGAPASGITGADLRLAGAFGGGGLALAGAAQGAAQVGAAVVTGIARQPEAQSRLYNTMFLIVGFCEATQLTLPLGRPSSLEPPPAYSELRSQVPVTRVITVDGQPAWLVTTYDDVATVLSDPRFGSPRPVPGSPATTPFSRTVPPTPGCAAWSPRSSRRAASPRCARASSSWPPTMSRPSSPGGPPADLVGALARQLPDLKLDDPVEKIEWTHNPFDAGPAALAVTW